MGAAALYGKGWAAATDSDLSEKSGEYTSPQVFAQMPLFCMSWMQVFPSRLLMLAWQSCIG